MPGGSTIISVIGAWANRGADSALSAMNNVAGNGLPVIGGILSHRPHGSASGLQSLQRLRHLRAVELQFPVLADDHSCRDHGLDPSLDPDQALGRRELN